MALYRIGRYFEARNNPRIARILIFLQQRFCSCQISHFASLRVGVIFPHPLGVVIGDGTVVEEGAWIFQQVTLGGKRMIGGDDLERITYPIVRRGAKLYPQSMAIGAITIGANAVVGAQSLVLADVPEGATVAGSPARIL